MYCFEEEAIWLVFGSQPGSIPARLQVNVLSTSPPVVIVLDETGTTVSSERMPLQSGVGTTTILPSFENHHVLYDRRFQETKTLNGGAMTL